MSNFIIIELIQYFFLQLVLNRVTGILKFFSRSKFSIHRLYLQHTSNSWVEKTTHEPRLSKPHLSKATVGDDGVSRDDLELLMTDLGVFYHPGGQKLPEVLNSAYVFGVFEAEQPRLDEVKEAFDVFDTNKDGFVDASELLRVLGVLGLKGRLDVEDCRKMIGAFDENADGRIDFDEFVKMMENTFC
ncbi:hypothetical protein R6Q59_014069 [Mikania micrantha]